MSAPKTNIEKQQRKHKGPLTGMAVAVGFALVLLFIWLLFVVDRGGVPQGADEQVDGRTGEIVDETADPVTSGN